MIREIGCLALLCVIIMGAYVILTDMFFKEAPSNGNNVTEPIEPHMSPATIGVGLSVQNTSNWGFDITTPLIAYVLTVIIECGMFFFFFKFLDIKNVSLRDSFLFLMVVNLVSWAVGMVLFLMMV